MSNKTPEKVSISKQLKIMNNDFENEKHFLADESSGQHCQNQEQQNSMEFAQVNHEMFQNSDELNKSNENEQEMGRNNKQQQGKKTPVNEMSESGKGKSNEKNQEKSINSSNKVVTRTQNQAKQNEESKSQQGMMVTRSRQKQKIDQNSNFLFFSKLLGGNEEQNSQENISDIFDNKGNNNVSFSFESDEVKKVCNNPTCKTSPEQLANQPLVKVKANIFYCPSCYKAYQDKQFCPFPQCQQIYFMTNDDCGTDWVGCDKCPQWVESIQFQYFFYQSHISCEEKYGLSNIRELLLNDQSDYLCLICRKKKLREQSSGKKRQIKNFPTYKKLKHENQKINLGGGENGGANVIRIPKVPFQEQQQYPQEKSVEPVTAVHMQPLNNNNIKKHSDQLVLECTQSIYQNAYVNALTNHQDFHKLQEKMQRFEKPNLHDPHQINFQNFTTLDVMLNSFGKRLQLTEAESGMDFEKLEIECKCKSNNNEVQMEAEKIENKTQKASQKVQQIRKSQRRKKAI